MQEVRFYERAQAIGMRDDALCFCAHDAAHCLNARITVLALAVLGALLVLKSARTSGWLLLFPT
jgi:hypothetical protein